MSRILFLLLTIFLTFAASGVSYGQDDDGGKKKKVKVKKEKKRKGMGSQEDLDALNQDATQSKAYKDYMKKIAKERKAKDKRNDVTRKKAEKKAEKRRRKAAKRTKGNKKNYGANNRGFLNIF